MWDADGGSSMSRLRVPRGRAKSQSSPRGDKGDADGGLGLGLFVHFNGSSAQIASGRTTTVVMLSSLGIVT